MGTNSKLLCKLISFFILFIVCTNYTYAQNTSLISKLVKNDPFFDSILLKPEYDIQVIYTKIERGKNDLKFKPHYFNVTKNYIYPSTSAILPAAVFTLEKINNIAKEHEGVNRGTYIKIDEAVTLNTLVYVDSSSENNLASYAHFIKKMLLVRDESAYNYCYDFLGQQYFNDRMHNLGYNNVWFLNKLNNDNPLNAKQTNRVTFFRNDLKSYYVDIIYLKRHATTIPFYALYVQDWLVNPIDLYSRRKSILMGKAYCKDGKVIQQAKDFSVYNQFGIEDMHNFLKNVIFPNTQKVKLNLADSDYNFLYKYMGMYPSQNNYPAYDNRTFPNNYCKYIMGDKLSPTLKVFNISGRDMGFITDNAYVIDTRNGVEFLLSIAVKCNKNDIFDEEYYEYESIGMPAIKRMSDIIYKYEISKKSKSVDFTDFLNKINE